MGAGLTDALRAILAQRGLPEGSIVLADGSLGPVRDWSWVLTAVDGRPAVGGIGRNAFRTYAVVEKTSEAVAIAIGLATTPLPLRKTPLLPDEQDTGRATGTGILERTRGCGGQAGSNGLQVGELLDVVGPETGHHLYALGTPFPARSQPPSDVGASYFTFRVAQPLPPVVLEGRAAPWFEQPGGGAMVVLDRPIRWYVDHGYLELMTGA